MTGRLPYHAQQYNRPNCDLGQGAPVNMAFISAKLKNAGYMIVAPSAIPRPQRCDPNLLPYAQIAAGGHSEPL